MKLYIVYNTNKKAMIPENNNFGKNTVKGKLESLMIRIKIMKVDKNLKNNTYADALFQNLFRI